MKLFYSNRQIWQMSYPILLGLFAQNIINVTDTAFLGRVGEVELGASALGGLYYICAFTIAFGFSTGSQIIIARRNGEKRYSEVGPVMIQGVFFLLGLAAFLFLFSRLFSESIMRVLVSSDVILESTQEFIYWRIFGFFFSFVNVMFRALYIGITRAKVLTLNAVFMAITNVLLDYLLIFGHAGFPELGLKGAAIASVIAEAVSIVFLVIYTRFAVDIKKYALNKIGSFDMNLLKRVLSISIFTMFQYFISMSTFFLFFVAVERLGQRELAIANIVRSVYIVMFIPVNALSTTTNSFVSNAIGAGYKDQVLAIIHKLAKFSFLTMAVLSTLVMCFPRAIISIYTNDPTLIDSSIPSLYVISVAMLISAVSNIYFNGVSGTGNTRTALWLELVTLAFYCIYIYIVAFRLRMPVEICFTTELIYFSFLLLFSFVYLKKGNWQKKKI
ncbi:MAG: MATE family efflux transporter [Tannerellaceae bacterium]|nr:MATE family efflux transporter [Tannerellaceae bacterium]